MTLSQRFNLPDIVAQVMAARDIDPDLANTFLDPSLRRDLPDPSVLKDMDAAAERCAAAIIAGEMIGIFGDYDVDGGTSTALLTRFFRAAGAASAFHIPDRQKEGYGPNAAALYALRDKGCGMVITVDCGTVSYEPLQAATKAGIDMVVLDHHIGEPRLPHALAVVNPNRFDEEDTGLGNLAAVGVTFLFVIAVNRLLRQQGWYSAERKEPNLMQWLDLVALGTVCDVVPLTGVNRTLVAQGLKIMAQRRNPGLVALMDIGNLDEPPGTYHAGFVLGPRINAGGRVGESTLGARLLSSDDPGEIGTIAAKLDQFNAERRAIEATVLESAIAQVDSLPELPAFVCAQGDGWHEGVIGIVAGRIKEHTNRPSAVIAIQNGIGKASARSIPGVDLGSAVTAARNAGLLLAGGGHAMAAGFSVEAPKIPELLEFLNHRIASAVDTHGARRTLKLDAHLPPSALTTSLAQTLERLAPFGMGNAEPRFWLPDVRILKADIVGGDHVRCILGEAGTGASASSGRLTGICFRCRETPLGELLLKSVGRTIQLAGRIRINRWQGTERAQLMIDDGALA